MPEDLRDAQRKRLAALVESSGLDLSTLARRAGLAPSTLTRFMNGNVKHALSARTFDKLTAAVGSAAPLEAANNELPKQLRVAAVLAVARVLEVSPGEIAQPSDRHREWFQAIERLPATAEDQALQLVRGIGDASAAANQHSRPSERLRSRRSR